VKVGVRDDLAMIAVQGPNARKKAASLLSAGDAAAALALKPFTAAEIAGMFIARTGYTGEDGWEIMLPDDSAAEFWTRLNDAGVRPCGLGARDTLRLEAGMNLYGHDMDETTTPLESGLSWTVALDPQERDFIGRAALEKQKAAGMRRKLVGLILQGKGVLRTHQKVFCEGGEGETTSGSFSPTLGVSIGMARVPVECTETCEVEIRGKLLRARVVKTTFVRNGKAVVDL
jgi:aminomethyltransferase